MIRTYAQRRDPGGAIAHQSPTCHRAAAAVTRTLEGRVRKEEEQHMRRAEKRTMWALRNVRTTLCWAAHPRSAAFALLRKPIKETKNIYLMINFRMFVINISHPYDENKCGSIR
jgi:hypothetical protein